MREEIVEDNGGLETRFVSSKVCFFFFFLIFFYFTNDYL